MKGTVSSAMSAGARRARVLVACLVLSSLAAPASAGDGNPATSDVADAPFAIPYEGFVMRNNAPYDSLGGTVPLTFRLHPAPGCGGCGADCCALWEETQDVVVHAGRFSVALGSTVPLDDVLLDAELTYLSITVDGVQLSGFQAIEPAAYAIWAANAADFTVSGTLATDQISPNAATFVSVTDDLVISGNGEALHIRPASWATGVRFKMTDEMTSRFAWRDGGGAYHTMLTLANTGVSVAEALTVGEATTLSGSLSVSGLATLSGGLTVSGTTTLNSALTVSGATTLNGTATLNGATTVDDTLRVTGAVSIGGTASEPRHRIDATQPLFKIVRQCIDTSVSYTTSVLASSYECWIGGLLFDGGDIQEVGSEGTLMRFYTFTVPWPGGSVWAVAVDFRSHEQHEEHCFVLVCAQKGLVDVTGNWTP